jgi:hypothetical protein
VWDSKRYVEANFLFSPNISEGIICSSNAAQEDN